MTWVTNDGVFTHLEPDILECEIMWTFGGIMTNLENVLKSKDITVPTEVHIVKTGFFQYSCIDLRVGHFLIYQLTNIQLF